jgi:hypothetical protein
MTMQLEPMSGVSLPTLLAPLISYETASIVGSDGQFEGVKITGCVLKGRPDEATIRDALQAVQRECQPCGAKFALAQLGPLKARTKSRADTDGAVNLATYADWLAEYPADVARQACEEWARGMIFWPAWAELQRVCDRLASGRLAVRKALLKALEPKPNVHYLGKPIPETRVQRLQGAINAFLRHSMPDKASATEMILAKEQNREPEAWAVEAQAKTIMGAPVPKVVSSPDALPPVAGSLLPARIAFWRKNGNEEYAQKLEAELAASESAA